MQSMKLLLEKSFVITVALLLNVIDTLKIDRQCTKQPITLVDIQAALLATEAVQRDDFFEGMMIGSTGYQVSKVVTKYLNEPHGAALRALIAKRDTFEGKTSIIAYRGTDETKVLDKFKSDLEDYGETEVYFGGKKTSVNKYIWLSFSKLYYHIEKYLYHPERRYIITGHSLGGAMASLLALMTKSRNKGIPWDHPGTCLVTFGAPRVGDKAYADRHDELISPTRKLRFVNRYDIVPHIPTSSVYQHHSREIWINRQNAMLTQKTTALLGNSNLLTYWKICGEGEPSYCSNRVSLLRYSPFDHDLLKYKKSILNPPNVYYGISDIRSFHDWSTAFAKSCPSSDIELPFSLPRVQKDQKEEVIDDNDVVIVTKNPTEPLKETANTWAQVAAQNLGKQTDHLVNTPTPTTLMNEKEIQQFNDTSIRPNVVYALDTLPTSWSQRIKPVTFVPNVPKVIYIKHDSTPKVHTKIAQNHDDNYDLLLAQTTMPSQANKLINGTGLSEWPQRTHNVLQVPISNAQINPNKLLSSKVTLLIRHKHPFTINKMAKLGRLITTTTGSPTAFNHVNETGILDSLVQSTPEEDVGTPVVSSPQGIQPVPAKHVVHNHRTKTNTVDSTVDNTPEEGLAMPIFSQQGNELIPLTHMAVDSLAQSTPTEDAVRMPTISSPQTMQSIPVTHMVHISSSQDTQPIPVTHIVRNHRKNEETVDSLFQSTPEEDLLRTPTSTIHHNGLKDTLGDLVSKARRNRNMKKGENSANTHAPQFWVVTSGSLPEAHNLINKVAHPEKVPQRSRKVGFSDVADLLANMPANIIKSPTSPMSRHGVNVPLNSLHKHGRKFYKNDTNVFDNFVTVVDLKPEEKVRIRKGTKLVKAVVDSVTKPGRAVADLVTLLQEQEKHRVIERHRVGKVTLRNSSHHTYIYVGSKVRQIH